MKPISASILTVGTEITSGEILNSNSQWIAEQLEKMGFDVTSHLSVPDDRKMIFDALQFLSQSSEVILVTGGLGPTSDDFTREVVSDWAKEPLIFNDQAWADLEKIYGDRKLTLRAAHRQQCHFSKSSVLLKNTVGTAHGFYLKKEAQHLIVLPGPPREIQGMWDVSVVPSLKALNPKPAFQLFRWLCIGVPESEVAEVVENIIAGTKLRVGYRASKPNVHVKIWIPSDLSPDEFTEKFDKALAKWLS